MIEKTSSFDCPALRVVKTAKEHFWSLNNLLEIWLDHLIFVSYGKDSFPFSLALPLTNGDYSTSSNGSEDQTDMNVSLIGSITMVVAILHISPPVSFLKYARRSKRYSVYWITFIFRGKMDPYWENTANVQLEHVLDTHRPQALTSRFSCCANCGNTDWLASLSDYWTQMRCFFKI